MFGSFCCGHTSRMKMLPALFLLALCAGACSSKKAKTPLADKEASASPARRAALAAIDAAYKRDLLPFVENKCFDCHGQAKAMPLYYKLPGVRQFLDGHIAEARADMDMRGGFPFTSPRPTEKDLKEFREVTEKGEMPLLSYRLIHWGSALTAAEKGAILRWVDESEKALAAAK